MSIYLTVPLVVLAIPAAFAVLVLWMVTPSWVFLVPGFGLMFVAGVAAGATALAYDGDVPRWVQVVGFVGVGLVVLAMPAIATEDD